MMNDKCSSHNVADNRQALTGCAKDTMPGSGGQWVRESIRKKQQGLCESGSDVPGKCHRCLTDARLSESHSTPVFEGKLPYDFKDGRRSSSLCLPIPS